MAYKVFTIVLMSALAIVFLVAIATSCSDQGNLPDGNSNEIDPIGITSVPETDETDPTETTNSPPEEMRTRLAREANDFRVDNNMPHSIILINGIGELSRNYGVSGWSCAQLAFEDQDIDRFVRGLDYATQVLGSVSTIIERETEWLQSLDYSGNRARWSLREVTVFSLSRDISWKVTYSDFGLVASYLSEVGLFIEEEFSDEVGSFDVNNPPVGDINGVLGDWPDFDDDWFSLVSEAIENYHFARLHLLFAQNELAWEYTGRPPVFDSRFSSQASRSWSDESDDFRISAQRRDEHWGRFWVQWLAEKDNLKRPQWQGWMIVRYS